jgi:hypothetical protein
MSTELHLSQHLHHHHDGKKRERKQHHENLLGNRQRAYWGRSSGKT